MMCINFANRAKNEAFGHFHELVHWFNLILHILILHLCALNRYGSLTITGLTITDVEPMAPGAMLQFSTSVEVRVGIVGRSVGWLVNTFSQKPC